MNDRRVTIFNPFRMMKENYWDDFMNDFVPVSVPEMEMYEDDDNVVIKLKVPGFKPEDLDISIEGKVLNITGKIEEEKEEEDTKRKYYCREMRNESFTRSVSLPTTVKADSAKADFKNGMLQLTLPKVEEVKPKRITVNVK